jgi:GNAT superfamily N-acetyltransferase
MVDNRIVIRVALPDDVGLVLWFIRELAEYERLADSLQVTEEVLREWMLRGVIEVLIVEVGGEAAGFALYYFTYSTFRGKTGIYIEDIFVLPKFRRQGIGTKFFHKIANIAKFHNCFRIDWMVLNWNSSSIDFYKKLGGCPIDDWTTFRLSESQINTLANETNLSE